MHLTKTYKFRLNPTTEQEHLFSCFAGCRRFVWNWGLARKKTFYRETGKSLSYNALASELVELKQQPETAFLAECPSQVLQQTLMDLEKAFKSFFEKRAKYPKFKSRKKTPNAFRIPQKVFAVEGSVSVPKVGLVPAVLHREIEGCIKSATIKQEADGKWHVCFVAHIEQPDMEWRGIDAPCGIDVGLETFLTFDDGKKVAPPKFYRKAQRKLRRAHKALSRTRKQSRNRSKAGKRLAILHRKVKNQRNDFLHKESIKVIHQYDCICLENLNLRGLARTKLSRSFSEAGIGEFGRMLEYKALWNYRTVVRVGRWFPSSKTCHQCNHQQSLLLSERRWVCGGCGTLHDRDRNAALNLLREGLRLLAVGNTDSLNVCRESVSPATAGCSR